VLCLFSGLHYVYFVLSSPCPCKSFLCVRSHSLVCLQAGLLQKEHPISVRSKAKDSGFYLLFCGYNQLVPKFHYFEEPLHFLLIFTSPLAKYYFASGKIVSVFPSGCLMLMTPFSPTLIVVPSVLTIVVLPSGCAVQTVPSG